MPTQIFKINAAVVIAVRSKTVQKSAHMLVWCANTLTQ